MENAAKTIARLRAHAAGSGPEATIAAALLKELEAKFPGAAQAADAAAEEIGERRYGLASWHDRELLVCLAAYLGCDALGRKKTRHRELWLRGPRSVVEASPAIYKVLRSRLAELHKGTTIGFLVGALPTQVDNAESSETKKLELSEDAISAAQTALLVGLRSQPRSLLGAGSGNVSGRSS